MKCAVTLSAGKERCVWHLSVLSAVYRLLKPSESIFLTALDTSAVLQDKMATSQTHLDWVGHCSLVKEQRTLSLASKSQFYSSYLLPSAFSCLSKLLWDCDFTKKHLINCQDRKEQADYFRRTLLLYPTMHLGSSDMCLLPLDLRLYLGWVLPGAGRFSLLALTHAVFDCECALTYSRCEKLCRLTALHQWLCCKETQSLPQSVCTDTTPGSYYAHSPVPIV